MLDDDELMYTRILNYNATPNEITDYIDKLHKEIAELKEAIHKERILAEAQISYELEQKIKDKIEDLELERGEEISFTLKGERLYSKEDFQIEILQELLKEN